jgi:hypothetical protein
VGNLEVVDICAGADLQISRVDSLFQILQLRGTDLRKGIRGDLAKEKREKKKEMTQINCSQRGSVTN